MNTCPKCGEKLFLRYCSGDWFRVCLANCCDFMVQVTEQEIVRLTGRY